MKTVLGLSAALACAVVTAPAFAADAPDRFPGLFAAPLGGAGAKVAGTHERGGLAQPNPKRLYPPSCASGTLPDKPSGSILEKEIVLLAAKSGRAVGETAKVIVWRVPCSSSGAPTPYNSTGAPNSMTLVRIERSAELTDQYYFLPVFSIAQGTIEFGKPASYPRLSGEPNTRSTDVLPGVALYPSTTYVLENATFNEAGVFDFSKAFKLRVDPRNQYISASQAVDIDVPAYTAPADFSMPFDGYAAAQWTNGERQHGLLVQVTENVNAEGVVARQIVYDLLTQDTEGNPFWIVGSTPIAEGADSVTVDAYSLGKELALVPWGKATFKLKHCNRLDVTYEPNADLEAPVPSFDGTISYDRLFTANGMTCE